MCATMDSILLVTAKSVEEMVESDRAHDDEYTGFENVSSGTALSNTSPAQTEITAMDLTMTGEYLLDYPTRQSAPDDGFLIPFVVSTPIDGSQDVEGKESESGDVGNGKLSGGELHGSVCQGATVDATPPRQTTSIASPVSAVDSTPTAFRTPLVPVSRLATDSQDPRPDSRATSTASNSCGGSTDQSPVLFSADAGTHQKWSSPLAAKQGSLVSTHVSLDGEGCSAGSSLELSISPSDHHNVRSSTPSRTVPCSGSQEPISQETSMASPSERIQTQSSNSLNFTASVQPPIALEDRIRISYETFGLDGGQLQWSFAPPPCGQLGFRINLSAVAKTKAALTSLSFSQLCRRRDQVLASIPIAGGPNRSDINLVRRLCNVQWTPDKPLGLRNIVLELSRQLAINRCDRSLIRFMMCSVLALMKGTHEGEYKVAVKAISEHELRTTLAYMSFHHILNGLGERWKGKHLTVLGFLLKTSTNNLKACFQAPTLPATLQLFHQKFEDADFAQGHLQAITDLITLCVPQQKRAAFERWTPLGIIQHLLQGVADPLDVGEAFGYDSHYQERASRQLPVLDNRRGLWNPQDLFTPRPMRVFPITDFSGAEGAHPPRNTAGKRSRDDTGGPEIDVESPSKRLKFVNTGLDVHIRDAASSSSKTFNCQSLEQMTDRNGKEWKHNISPENQRRKRNSTNYSSSRVARHLNKSSLVAPADGPKPDSTETDLSFQPSLSDVHVVPVSTDEVESSRRDSEPTPSSRLSPGLESTCDVPSPKDLTFGRLLTAKVQAFAAELEAEGETVWTEDNVPSVVAGVCGASSVLRLRPDEWYNDELINTIPIIGVHTQSRSWLLPSWIYEKLKARKFEQLDLWRDRLCSRRLTSWVFAVCENYHWRAVKIDFDERIISAYDPRNDRLALDTLRMLGIVKDWLSAFDRGSWTLRHAEGPYHPRDTTNCGVYVSWVLRQWTKESRIAPGQDVDALNFRDDALTLLRNAPRARGLPAAGEEDSASTSSSVEATLFQSAKSAGN
ncbi:hypothetical protein BDY17DRAFT_91236 [Neohortaea acidophila]|uniref:Ubiquitin-like protease family profile domain-containing protein n=1 Tax=Neohortaea acidophila TaxID=245834 RepID=A0A6A6PET8_9PEZI|nr:uncharacterized protein BDY17DRAFT_91236 [Neohortaea acidophila]KAF2478445.1 hypothetical protein BDY17DRAFT_91236 [Neohortaea acidophila]